MTLTPSVADQDARHRAGSRTEAGARRPDRGTERWAPTRAGILNVWRYYDEVFAFHRGRLLLRGPNGTGKSKALEVLLPFLFDASLRPNRLSTFGTADRTMHWNLMGEGATGVTRVGYVWLEFGQGDRWFTCGARLQASAHTTGVGADYFTTTRRVGVPQGLHLVNEQGQPLTRAALAEALGDHGTLHAGPGDYRLTLRTALFPGVGEQRFDALVTALLQLRTPKLSQRLDPGLLSALLSRALPALDQADVAELAEGFERLDRRREELRHLDDVVAAAEQVAAHARTYARRVLRAGSAALIAATSTMDRLTREARTSQDSYQEVSAELETATRLRETLLAQQLAVEARITGLTASEAYRRGEHLVQLRSQSGRARRQADELASVADRRVAAASAAGAAADRQRDVAREAGSAVDQARDELARHAERLSLGSTVPVADPHLDAFAARALVQAAVSERSRQIEEVRGAAARHRQAVADRERAESERERVRTRHAEAVQAHEESESAHQAAVAALTGELEAWASGCTQLRLDVEQLLARAGSAAAVARLVSEARHARAATLADEASTLSARMTSTAERRDAVRAQLEECLSAVDLPPAAPATRTADRTGWPGAPLWRVTDFVPGLPARLQAGIEAALEGCGLLDAWISPDGGVLDESGHDVFAVVEPDRLPGAAAAHPGPDRSLAAGAEPAGAGPAAAGAGPAAAGAGPAAAGAGTSGGVAGAGTGAGETLSSVLVPEPDGPVPAHVVSALLERVALDTTLPPRGDVAIGADGSWRMAALTGSYGKPEACYIGATARRRARDRRIEQLRADLSLVQAALDELTDAWDEVTGRQRQLQAEAGRLPGHDAVDAARHRADKQAARVEAAQESLTAAAAGVAEAEGHAADMLRALAELCAGHGLPTDPGALDAVARAVGELVAAADRWLHAHATAHREREVAAMHEGAAGEARAAARDACDQAAQARDVAVELAARLEAVELAVGTGYEQVLEHLAAARGEQESLRDRLARLGDTLVRLSTRKGALDTARTRDAAERDAAVAERDAVGQHVRALAAGFLPKDAGLVLAPGAADGVKATLELARAVAARWASLPHEPRHVAEAQSRLMETLHTTRDVLTRHADAELVDDGQVRVLSASVGGLRVGAAGLLEAVTAERDSSRDDITASEHDLFDTTLTGDTRRHLAARIRQAGALVDAMNARLDLVRTASDVAVRLTWQVDPALPPSTRTARELLLKDPVHLSEQDRAALHAFFRERIETARAANTATSWEQQLTEVFDYTAWHQFVVKVDRSRGAGWEVLTRKLHGALSGGEKAIALHLPLFAAIAAHYEAVPEAPRLILLDEVFVGVDAANRGQVFALLSALDLDLVLTSDHEWCTYAELDGIAVHQLVAGDGDGDAAVTSVRFTWDGRSLHADADADTDADTDTDTGAAQAAP